MELLKLRFGEAQMHYCEVMLKVTFGVFFFKFKSWVFELIGEGERLEE